MKQTGQGLLASTMPEGVLLRRHWDGALLKAREPGLLRSLQLVAAARGRGPWTRLRASSQAIASARRSVPLSPPGRCGPRQRSLSIRPGASAHA